MSKVLWLGAIGTVLLVIGCERQPTSPRPGAEPELVPLLSVQSTDPTLRSYFDQPWTTGGGVCIGYTPCYAADDFEVPVGANWRVSHVSLTGLLKDGRSVFLRFYKDNAGTPGTLVSEAAALTPISATRVPNSAFYSRYVVALPTPLALGAGKYWIGVRSHDGTSDDFTYGFAGAGSGLTWTWKTETSPVWYAGNPGSHLSFGLYEDVTPRPPVAVVNGPYVGDEGQRMQLSSAGSNDPNGDSVSYAWRINGAPKSTHPNPTLSFPDQGIYEIALVVTDRTGRSDTASTIATIASIRPTGDFQAPTSVPEGSPYTLKMKAKDGPADVAAGLEIWFDCAFGEWGNSHYGVTASQSCPARGDQDNWPVLDETIVYARARVTDKDGEWNEWTRRVSITNAKPVVTLRAIGPTTVAVGQVVSFEGSFTDAGAYDAPWRATLVWKQGPKEVIVAQTQGGTHSFRRAYTTAGIYNVLLEVMDKDGGVGKSNVISITVTP
jgi:hypothetical protein